MRGGECVGLRCFETRAKAGKGSMIMVASDANGTPLNVEVESASMYEGHIAEETVDRIKMKKHGARRKRPKRLVPKRVISDKGYDDNGLRKRPLHQNLWVGSVSGNFPSV